MTSKVVVLGPAGSNTTVCVGTTAHVELRPLAKLPKDEDVDSPAPDRYGGIEGLEPGD